VKVKHVLTILLITRRKTALKLCVCVTRVCLAVEWGLAKENFSVKIYIYIFSCNPCSLLMKL